MKKLFILTFMLAFSLTFMTIEKVNAVSYDSELDQVIGIEVKEDGTLSWKNGLYAYGIWVKHPDDSYATALINAVSEDSTNTVNLINLIEEKCISSAYGCPLVDGIPSKTGMFNVLIQENNAAGKYTNSEFTITYDGTKLSGSIVGVKPDIPTFTVTFDSNGGSSVPSQTVEYGEPYVRPEDPIKEGYEFIRWDNSEGMLSDYDGTIKKDMIFIAFWAKRYNPSKSSQDFYLDSNDDIILSSNAPFKNFLDFWIYSADDEEDDSLWYEMHNNMEEDVDYIIDNENGTITLKNSFLKTMPEGKYTIEINYDSENESDYGYGYAHSTLNIIGKEPILIENSTIKGLEVKYYTGNKIVQNLIIKYGNILLEENKDYKISYKDNVNVGIATVTITGIGNYTGTKELKFKIKQGIAVNKSSIAMYKWSTFQLQTTVVGNEKVAYESENPAIATVSSNGLITAKKLGETIINIKTASGKLAKVKVGVYPIKASMVEVSAIGNQVYTGKGIAPNVIVKYNGVVLKLDRDYTLSYGKNRNIGNGTIKIIFKGSYTGTKTITFLIVPRATTITKLENTKAGRGTVYYNEIKEATGYQIAYKVTGTNGWTYLKSTEAAKFIRNLEKGKYTVTVRSYTTVDNKNYYSSWSPTKVLNITK